MPFVRALSVLALASFAFVFACAPPPAPAAAPAQPPVVDAVVATPSVGGGPRSIDNEIAKAVAREREEQAWPRQPAPAHAAPAAAKVETPLGKMICSGNPGPKERPHRAACCYPAKELLLRPLRATFPTLRACYELRSNGAAQGRVAFTFRIEQDGSIAQACSDPSSTMVDEGAIRCMVEALRKIRYPGSDDAEVDFCGLMTITYPVVFEP